MSNCTINVSFKRALGMSWNIVKLQARSVYLAITLVETDQQKKDDIRIEVPTSIQISSQSCVHAWDCISKTKSQILIICFYYYISHFLQNAKNRKRICKRIKQIRHCKHSVGQRFIRKIVSNHKDSTDPKIIANCMLLIIVLLR